MQYSPKLKAAMEEIKTILKENDIAGFVVLHTPGFSEYLNYIDTSYSCAKFNQSKVDIVNPTNKTANDTYNMFVHFADTISANCMNYIRVAEDLEKKWNGEQFGGSHTSHNQQNN